MTKTTPPKQHPHIEHKIGILIINLGTPSHYGYFSIRKYLKEFLSDPRVIETNPILWKMLLHCFILPIRPFMTGKKYKQIWLAKHNQSPLRYYTQAQAKKLHALTHSKHPAWIVDYAMRYGQPSIEKKITDLMKQGCHQILFMPLYPQYCSATTASVNDEIYRVLKTIRWQPDIRIVPHYPDHPQYINALVTSVKNHLKKLSFTPDALVSSYHGIPQTYFDQGDPYSCFCYKTNRLFNQALEKAAIKIENHISFQSRFGPKAWLQPYTADVLKTLIAKGHKKILLIAPGFAADCIETLEEIDIEYKNLFLSLGGEQFARVPCLNDHPDHIQLIYQLLLSNLWHSPPKQA
jgi:protoporphyrin/coproporphyrin ferrochelatase